MQHFIKTAKNTKIYLTSLKIDFDYSNNLTLVKLLFKYKSLK